MKAGKSSETVHVLFSRMASARPTSAFAVGKSPERRASTPTASNADLYTLTTSQLTVSYTPDLFGANRRAVESSPIATIDQWHSPVLLVQADDDRDVPHQTTELIEDLRSRNIDHDVIMIPNEIHVMARYSSWMILFNAADVYFDRHLDKRSAPAP